eukprot:CAMPEP_0172597332 /NCGR_PEP_ID=MMETSP1068-20121228/17318_1 /TAXON_ID=35684 /ORGANISM="Pseudopedinella elastica, Strain CCMP716" /LENGTH=55 /DNA_ID=CAMNT_0013396807 /DNA_START=44 /DNA_END=207 /DNA_ORIENTATION=-
MGSAPSIFLPSRDHYEPDEGPVGSRREDERLSIKAAVDYCRENLFTQAPMSVVAL